MGAMVALAALAATLGGLVASTAHDYDGISATAAPGQSRSEDLPADQGVPVDPYGQALVRRAYDDRTQLARAPARLVGYRLAPQTRLPSVIYREGTPRPGNLTPRAVDDGALSFRDSLSNPWPLAPGQRPVFRPGEPYIGIDTSRLPPGSVIPDNIPPGHVSVRGVSVDEFLEALIERGKFPK